jgi:hypothetical protein
LLGQILAIPVSTPQLLNQGAKMISIPYSHQQLTSMKPTATTQSKLLTQFYRAYTGWLDAGAPDQIVFTRSRGLCTNLINWVRTIDLDLSDRLKVNKEMRHQFLAARRDESYPFDGHPDVYTRTMTEGSCYLNEHRIKWVREHAQAA